MIRYDDVLPLLLGACPTFAVSHEAAAHDDGDGHFVHIARFASHLIRLLAEGHIDQFPAMFHAAQRVLLAGDEAARSLICEGFVRDLTSFELFLGTPLELTDFHPWLARLSSRHPRLHFGLDVARAVRKLLAPAVQRRSAGGPVGWPWFSRETGGSPHK